MYAVKIERAADEYGGDSSTVISTAAAVIRRASSSGIRRSVMMTASDISVDEAVGASAFIVGSRFLSVVAVDVSQSVRENIIRAPVPYLDRLLI